MIKLCAAYNFILVYKVTFTLLKVWSPWRLDFQKCNTFFFLSFERMDLIIFGGLWIKIYIITWYDSIQWLLETYSLLVLYFAVRVYTYFSISRCVKKNIRRITFLLGAISLSQEADLEWQIHGNYCQDHVHSPLKS